MLNIAAIWWLVKYCWGYVIHHQLFSDISCFDLRCQSRESITGSPCLLNVFVDKPHVWHEDSMTPTLKETKECHQLSVSAELLSSLFIFYICTRQAWYCSHISWDSISIRRLSSNIFLYFFTSDAFRLLEDVSYSGRRHCNRMFSSSKPDLWPVTCSLGSGSWQFKKGSPDEAFCPCVGSSNRLLCGCSVTQLVNKAAFCHYSCASEQPCDQEVGPMPF